MRDGGWKREIGSKNTTGFYYGSVTKGNPEKIKNQRLMTSRLSEPKRKGENYLKKIKSLHKSFHND